MVSPCEMSFFVLFSGLGKLLMFIFRKFPLTEKIASKNTTLQTLYTCNLCLGVWFYTFMAFVLNYNAFPEIKNKTFGKFVTGCFTSFINWLFWNGVDSQFRDIILEQ